jgi:uracil-DNA glycosylase
MTTKKDPLAREKAIEPLIVPAKNKSKKTIMIITYKPSTTELQTQQPFVDTAGMKLINHVNKYNDHYRVVVTHAIPKGNVTSPFVLTPEIESYYHDDVLKRIAKEQPEAVILMGAPTAKIVMADGHGKTVREYRRKKNVIEIQKGNTSKEIPAYVTFAHNYFTGAFINPYPNDIQKVLRHDFASPLAPLK